MPWRGFQPTFNINPGPVVLNFRKEGRKKIGRVKDRSREVAREKFQFQVVEAEKQG